MAVLSRLVAAVVLTAATGLALPAAPASAAACATADGVTVVVDFHELGGGLHQVCDAGGGGKTAATQFGEAGFDLTRVQRQPGFVCRVDGAPADDQCVNTPPADAYWGLWWSNGTSGTWTYASEGVDSLTVPEGGYVALSWNGSTTKSPPGSAPAPHPASSSPSPTAQPAPSGGGGAGGGGGGSSSSGGGTASGSPSAAASGSASARPGPHRKDTGRTADRKGKHAKKPRPAGPSAVPGASETPDATVAPDGSSTSADPPTPGDGGLPSWVAPAGIGLLFAAAAATAVVRRRRGTPGP